MSDEIKVHVVKYADRDNLIMRYRDPGTGRQFSRSTATTSRKEAEKLAAKWEAELQEGRYQKPSRLAWVAFREHYDEHVLSGMKPTTACAYDVTMNVFERLANPQRLADCTTERITAFATELRKKARSPATVARHLRHLKVAVG